MSRKSKSKSRVSIYSKEAKLLLSPLKRCIVQSTCTRRLAGPPGAMVSYILEAQYWTQLLAGKALCGDVFQISLGEGNSYNKAMYNLHPAMQILYL